MDDVLKFIRNNLKNLSKDPGDLFDNFDNYFTQATKDMGDYADTYVKNGPKIYQQIREEAANSSDVFLQRQTAIERQELRRRKRQREFVNEDGAKIKQYLDNDGNIKTQVKTTPDGIREVRRQHSPDVIKADPRAGYMSAVVSEYDGKTVEIHRRPDPRHVETKIINYETGEVYKRGQKRTFDWGGGAYDTYNDYSTIEEERLIHNKKMDDKYGTSTTERTVENQQTPETTVPETQPETTVPETQQSVPQGQSNINWDDAGNWDDDYILNQAGDNEQLLNDMMNARDEKVRQTTNNTAEQVNNQTPEEPINGPQQTVNENAGVNPDDPLTWDDDYIRNVADGDPDLAQEMINQREQARSVNTPETPKYEGVDPNKPATWTDDYINDTAGSPEEIDDMLSRRDIAQNKDIVNQINQQRHAEDVPLNREQRRRAAKENRKKGNTEKPKTKKQKERDKRNKKFNDRNTAMGRDPEETKRINREANEQKETKNRERNKRQQQRAEEARINKERGEKIYKDIVDEWNEKPILEQMSMFNESEEARNLRWKQQSESNISELGNRKAEIESIPEAMRNPELQNELDNINSRLDELDKFKSSIDNGKINQGLDFEHHNMTQEASDYVDWANDLDAKSKAYEFDGSYTAQKEFADNSGKLIKTKKVTKGLDIGDVSKVGLVTAGLNILGAVGDYKDERRKGRGVVSSAVRAGVKFAAFEAMGLWSIPVMLVAHAPGAVIKGADMLYKENRRMNSAANNQVFGGAQFMDTQQLATMRQSGMEMAKMSQYNLQQTLMGNEATYLHR